MHSSCGKFVQGLEPSGFESFVFESVDLLSVFPSLAVWAKCAELLEVDACPRAMLARFRVLFVKEVFDVLEGGP